MNKKNSIFWIIGILSLVFVSCDSFLNNGEVTEVAGYEGLNGNYFLIKENGSEITTKNNVTIENYKLSIKNHNLKLVKNGQVMTNVADHEVKAGYWNLSGDILSIKLNYCQITDTFELKKKAAVVPDGGSTPGDGETSGGSSTPDSSITPDGDSTPPSDVGSGDGKQDGSGSVSGGGTEGSVHEGSGSASGENNGN